MQHCGSPAKCMTLPNSLGKYLQLSTKKGEMAALIFRLALTEWLTSPVHSFATLHI